MRRYVFPVVAALGLASLSAASEAARTVLSVKGLGCAGCAEAFEANRGKVLGLRGVTARS